MPAKTNTPSDAYAMHTVEQIAERASLSKSTVWRAIKAGDLTATHIGKASTRIREDHYREWISKLTTTQGGAS